MRSSNIHLISPQFEIGKTLEVEGISQISLLINPIFIKLARKTNENKAVYTAASVTCGWAGAVW